MRIVLFVLLLCLGGVPVLAQSPYERGRGGQVEVSPYEQGPGATLAQARDNYMSLTGRYRLTDRLDVQAQLGYTDTDSYVYGQVGMGWLQPLRPEGWSTRLDLRLASGARSEGFTGLRHMAEGQVMVFRALTRSRDVQAFPAGFISAQVDAERHVVRYDYWWPQTPAVPPGYPVNTEEQVHWENDLNVWFGLTMPSYIRLWRSLRVLLVPSIGLGTRAADVDVTLQAGAQYSF